MQGKATPVVLLVVLSHIDLRFRIKQFDVSWLAPEPVRQVLFHSGYFAVIAFFVISGFLITSISRERWSSLSGVSVSQFYWSRFARIGPCLLLLVALLSVLHWAQVAEFVIKPERATLGEAVFAALTFHVSWLEGGKDIFQAAGIFFDRCRLRKVFYLAFPLVCLLCRRERWLFLPLKSAGSTATRPASTYAAESVTEAQVRECREALSIFRFERWRLRSSRGLP